MAGMESQAVLEELHLGHAVDTRVCFQGLLRELYHGMVCLDVTRPIILTAECLGRGFAPREFRLTMFRPRSECRPPFEHDDEPSDTKIFRGTPSRILSYFEDIIVDQPAFVTCIDLWLQKAGPPDTFELMVSIVHNPGCDHVFFNADTDTTLHPARDNAPTRLGSLRDTIHSVSRHTSVYRPLHLDPAVGAVLGHCRCNMVGMDQVPDKDRFEWRVPDESCDPYSLGERFEHHRGSQILLDIVERAQAVRTPSQQELDIIFEAFEGVMADRARRRLAAAETSSQHSGPASELPSDQE
ncbi:hypothetical protein F4776DRAFT_635890 [Hypoxylon sp. NC0597]|nr:hypothetical protein F4776DRAFT_635890 [Hypoxylon sp. NC0597]